MNAEPTPNTAPATPAPAPAPNPDDDALDDAKISALDALLKDREVRTLDANAAAAINRSELEMQIDAARRYPRSIGKFLADAEALATLSVSVAESCMYTLPRAKKNITGPSARLAEIMASAYGNLLVVSRILDPDARDAQAQGIAWDIEKNYRVSNDIRRRILDNKGVRYNDDMIGVTGMAAASIARRNAIFMVIPRSYVMRVYEKAKKVAIGDAATLSERRERAISIFNKMGITTERVLERIERATVADIGLEDLEVLFGIKTAIKEGASIEEHFPEATSGGADADAKGGNGKKGVAERVADRKAAAKPTEAPAQPKADAKPTTKQETLPEPTPTHREHKPELCTTCGKPVTGQGIHSDKDGVIGLRHPDCSPF